MAETNAETQKQTQKPGFLKKPGFYQRRNRVSRKNRWFGNQRSTQKPGFSTKETGFLGKIVGLAIRDQRRNPVSRPKKPGFYQPNKPGFWTTELWVAQL
ncbi:hypothetical protein [Microseira sp. BLCC-F43]|uniref:hypothetical protein n=1 Tax=Microseira sp. BLCC-F43 TaxID=3153602 RepID=UPI0035B76070